MAHYLVSITNHFPGGGSSRFMDVIEAKKEDQAAKDGIIRFSNGDDLEWESSHSATSALGDAYYAISNIQILSPDNAPIFKTYLDKAFPPARRSAGQ